MWRPSFNILTFGSASIFVLAAIFWLNCFVPDLRLGPKKWSLAWALFWTVGPAFQLFCLIDLLNFQAILVDAIWMFVLLLLPSLLLRLISWSRKQFTKPRKVFSA